MLCQCLIHTRASPQTHIQTRTQTKTRLHDANPGKTKLSYLYVARIYSRYLEFGLEI